MTKIHLAAPVLITPGTIRAFNPQPEPPREMMPGAASAGTIRAFNPQPEPPREMMPGFDSHHGDLAQADWLIG
ncbi:hypothetical protein [Neotabrizicola sp. VNH66]|uniref:hypothetical protein n=1 Tax=Neotabrizicola sp. VNH66 TaxID=3400918 RepID=UPI003BFC20E7